MYICSLINIVRLIIFICLYYIYDAFYILLIIFIFTLSMIFITLYLLYYTYYILFVKQSFSLETTPANTVTTNLFSFPTSSCDETFKNNFVTNFKEMILSLQSVWRICGTTCDFKNIRVR